MMEITKNSLAVFLTESLVADLSNAAFGKIIAVYGHIDENGSSVRKNSAISNPVLRTNAPKRVKS